MCYKAIEGIDYNAGPYTATFPIGFTNASFDIMINDDGVLEDNESFFIIINSISNGHGISDPRTNMVTITDTTGKTNCF